MRKERERESERERDVSFLALEKKNTSCMYEAKKKKERKERS